MADDNKKESDKVKPILLRLCGNVYRIYSDKSENGGRRIKFEIQRMPPGPKVSRIEAHIGEQLKMAGIVYKETYFMDGRHINTAGYTRYKHTQFCVVL